MIITLTLNPALDKTANIQPLVLGGLNRIESSELDAGGKGINVSKLLLALGEESVATGFVGSSTGEALLTMLDDLSLTHDFVKTKGVTRINLKLLDSVNGITEVNDPGVVVSDDEEKALLEKLFALASEHSSKPLFVLSGSMHKNASPSFYKDLTKKLKEKNATVFVDADGIAFKEALEAAPDFVKPNKEELLQYFGRDTKESVSQEELISLCKELINTKKIGLVALSMGHEGAIFVSKDKCAFAPALKVDVSSTVGAGDSMVGAVAYATHKGLAFEDIVRYGMAASAGAVTTIGTKAPSMECIETLLKQVKFEYK